MPRPFPFKSLFLVLVVALTARIFLLASGSVSFHSDEAVVSLMARHILAGERPTFFYGQAYMGSLDAWLVALGFRLFGETVLTIRLVQSALYLLTVAVYVALAWRFTARRTATVAAGLLLAIPTVNGALYTTATLGGYNETLLLGGLLLWLGHAVLFTVPNSRWRWAALGFVAGFGWWANGLIVVYGLVVAGWLVQRMWQSKRLPLVGLLIALVGFMIGSAPWWVFDIQHQGAALSFLLNRPVGEFAGVVYPHVSALERLVGLLLFGLPTLLGMRFPWASDYFAPVVGFGVVAIVMIALLRTVRGGQRYASGGRWLVLGMPLILFSLFIASNFGADPTGRYYLPLVLPLALLIGNLMPAQYATDSIVGARFIPPAKEDEASYRPYMGLRGQAVKFLPILAIALMLVYNAAGQISAARGEYGLTTQFDTVSHIANDHDAELIAFLEKNGLYNGYTSYWVAFRIAFLSGERLQYHAALPYKTTLIYNAADNRYKPYAEATAKAERVAVITANLATLDALLQERWAAAGVTYQSERIGAFTVYYDFTPALPLESVSHFPTPS